MRKLLTVLLGFALAVSVVSPAVAGPVAGPLAQTSPTEGSTLTATEAGTLAGHWAQFDKLRDEVDKDSSWPDDADNPVFSSVVANVRSILRDYFRENVESKSPWICTQHNANPDSDEAVEAMFNPTVTSLRTTVYQKLGCPWPEEEYAEWVSFYTSFRSAFYSVAPRVMPYPEAPSLMKNYGAQAEFGAKVGQLLYLHSKLEEQLPTSLVTDFAAETTRFHSKIAQVIDATVCPLDSGDGDAALEALLNGKSRRDIYKILGQPWPASRWVTWDQLHKAFTKVNTTAM